MYKSHSLIHPPSNPHQKIWRYVNTDTYLDLITKEHLYFTPCNRFDDPLEGTCTRKDLEFFTSMGPKLANDYRYHLEKIKPFVAVNCWHINDNESLSMWKIYTEKGKGIVIESTYSRLIQSLKAARDDIFIGKVDYIDHYENDEYTCGNALSCYFKKDSSFSYEQELRAVKWLHKSKNGKTDYETFPTSQEYLTPIDVTLLVESIRFSPELDPWLCEALRIVTEKFYPELNLRPSQLIKKPPHLATTN
jgi:hypothetical protein